MKIALIGYGKMGKIIERIALERGHEIVSIIDIQNPNDFSSEAFKGAQVAIEFSAPHVALDNIRKAFAAGVPVVSGTTGWTDALPELKKEIDSKGYTLFWASNYSLGVSIFAAVNKYLAKIMNRFDNYNVEMTEVHHTQKLDAPSGTAITLAEGILEKMDRKSSWVKEEQTQTREIAIKSIREGQVPGIHIVHYESEVDSIEITHDAKSRDGLQWGQLSQLSLLLEKKVY